MGTLAGDQVALAIHHQAIGLAARFAEHGGLTAGRIEPHRAHTDVRKKDHALRSQRRPFGKLATDPHQLRLGALEHDQILSRRFKICCPQRPNACNENKKNPHAPLPQTLDAASMAFDPNTPPTRKPMGCLENQPRKMRRFICSQRSCPADCPRHHPTGRRPRHLSPRLRLHAGSYYGRSPPRPIRLAPRP